MTSAVTAHIHLDALRHNLARVRELTPGCQVMAVIKADAYGHGIVRAARSLIDVDAFAVARLEEALELKRAQITAPIVLLEGVFEAGGLEVASDNGLEVVVHHRYQLEMLEQAEGLSAPLKVWLKIDSGMHRLGIPSAFAAEAYQRLSVLEAVSTIRLMTHLASADDLQSNQTNTQLACFSAVIPELSGEVSIANSAGIMAWPSSHGDWVRPGVMLYGVSPFESETGGDRGLRPAMTLTSQLISINMCRQGDTVGYGASWVCPEDMAVGVVACGYGDGYPRHAVAGTPVLINGVRVPLIGRVSMDTLCVDLRGYPDASIGDQAVLWGQGLAVEEVARCASTIAYELLCAVTRRVAVLERD